MHGAREDLGEVDPLVTTAVESWIWVRQESWDVGV
jgi:hypothetical protein